MKIVSKLIVSMFVFCLLVGCGNTAKQKEAKFDSEEDQIQYVNVFKDIDKDSLEKIDISSYFKINISDVESLRDDVSNVFIGTVDSILGTSTTIGVGRFGSPKTYGNITVLQNLKGEITESVITYARPGGIISVADYEKDAPEIFVKNMEEKRIADGTPEIDKENTYLEFKFEHDIEFEVGKTYMFFARKSNVDDVYTIDGLQYGTREIKQEKSNLNSFRVLPSETSLLLKNNDTQEYESLNGFLERYFK